jgi:hypothetical protein
MIAHGGYAAVSNFFHTNGNNSGLLGKVIILGICQEA